MQLSVARSVFTAQNSLSEHADEPGYVTHQLTQAERLRGAITHDWEAVAETTMKLPSGADSYGVRGHATGRSLDYDIAAHGMSRGPREHDLLQLWQADQCASRSRTAWSRRCRRFQVGPARINPSGRWVIRCSADIPYGRTHAAHRNPATNPLERSCCRT